MALGFSMVFPGISAATMAVFLNIYSKLLEEISSVHFKSIFSKSLYKKHDWQFLALISLGILASLLIFLVLAPGLIEKYNLEFYGLVFGFTLSSLLPLFKKIPFKFSSAGLILLAGFISFFLISFTQGQDIFSFDRLGFTSMLLAGFITSVACILPGLSGSYILVLLGLYEPLLLAFKQFEAAKITGFTLAFCITLLSMSHIMRFLLKKFPKASLSLIFGLILGTLPSIVPAFDESVQGFAQESPAYFLFFSFLGVLPLSLLMVFSRRS